MKLYPVTKLEINTNLTAWEVETILRNEMGKKRFNWYDGDVKHSKFKFGSPRYFSRIPVSIVYGDILNIENGTKLLVHIRPSYIALLLPILIIVIALTKEYSLLELIVFLIVLLLLIYLQTIFYKHSVEKDIEFMEGLFKSVNT